MNHGAEQANIGIRHQAITYRLDRIIELLTALAASPAPDPGAGLREAAQVVLDLADRWPSTVDQWARDRLRAALAPSAEPPETTP